MGRYDEMRADELIARIVGGETEAATHLLLSRCGPGLKHLVQNRYRALGLEFNEVVNEIYLVLQRNDWRALRAFRGANEAGAACTLTHYVFCIASRWLRRRADSLKEKAEHLPLEQVEEHLADRRDIGEARLSAADLLQAVLSLPDPIDRAVVMLYKLEERDVGEVARLLNTSPGNVYTRCSRALTALKIRFRGEVTAWTKRN